MKKNKKIINIVAGALVIALISGGVVFASGIDDKKEGNIQSKTYDSVYMGDKDTDTNSDNYRDNKYEDMIDIMKENGYDDAARHMENKDYEAMTDYMNNISDEDYDEMIDIMNKNGYEYMGRMMENIDREDMLKFHNNMHGDNEDWNDMHNGNGCL